MSIVGWMNIKNTSPISEVFVCFTWSSQGDTQRTFEQNSLYQILRNYRTFKERLDRLQRILDNVVKPEGLELIKFV